MSGGLKDNPYLSFGVLTGILRVSKENLFSGLNNPVVNSVLDEKYSHYFGFTEKIRMKQMIKLTVPATSANLGADFDALGVVLTVI